MLATWICSLLGGVLAGAAAAQGRSPRGRPRSTLCPPSSPTTRRETRSEGPDTTTARYGPPCIRITVWTDPSGRRVSAPVTGTAARLQAGLIGALVAPAAGAAVSAAGWVVRTRLIRRRKAEWGQEWKQAGLQWGNLSA